MLAIIAKKCTSIKLVHLLAPAFDRQQSNSKFNIHLCCVQPPIADIDNDIYDEKQLYRYKNMDISLKTGLLSLVYQKSVID